MTIERVPALLHVRTKLMEPLAASTRWVVAVLSLVACTCGTAREPTVVVAWVYSEGDRAAALEQLMGRFNAAQTSVVVRPVRWKRPPLGAPLGQKILGALRTSNDDGTVPALVEVPEEGLVALVEAGLARDLSGQVAERSGMRLDDFRPWLMPEERVVSKGVVGIPLFHEAPVILSARGSGLAERVRSEGMKTFVALEGAEGSTGMPLAATADYRLFLAMLSATGALGPSDAEGGATLDSRRFGEAVALFEGVFPRGMLAKNARGDERVIGMLESGEARAALVWSKDLGAIERSDLDVVRAPVRTRGTYLVVFADAHWRARQDAFRVVQWLSEPMQSADLARRFWTVPTRASAAKSARYRHAEGNAAYRAVVTEPDRPLRLPARARFLDTIAAEVERASGGGGIDGGLFRELQLALEKADE